MKKLYAQYPRFIKYCCFIFVVCFVIVVITVLHQKRVVKETIHSCNINAFTLENQINGNTTAFYTEDEKQLSFTDHVLIGDDCFSFSVFTMMDLKDGVVTLLDQHNFEVTNSPSYEVTYIKSFWGDIFITQQRIQTMIDQSNIILDGVATLESQSGKTRDSYTLSIHYEYNVKDNLVKHRTIEIHKE